MTKKRGYKVLVPCSSDKTGESFEVGDIVTSKNFSKKVLEGWVGIGVLEPPGEEESDGYRED